MFCDNSFSGCSTSRAAGRGSRPGPPSPPPAEALAPRRPRPSPALHRARTDAPTARGVSDKIQRANRSATHVSSQIVGALDYIQQDRHPRVLWSFPLFPGPSSLPSRFPIHPARRSVHRPGSNTPPVPGPRISRAASAACLLARRGEPNPRPFRRRRFSPES